MRVQWRVFTCPGNNQVAVSTTVKRGAYLINTARGSLVERDAVVRALQSGRIAGYAGDVWLPPRRRPIIPADHALERHDAVHVRLVTVCTGALEILES